MALAILNGREAEHAGLVVGEGGHIPSPGVTPKSMHS